MKKKASRKVREHPVTTMIRRKINKLLKDSEEKLRRRDEEEALVKR